MRILIADDTATLPDSVQSLLQQCSGGAHDAAPASAARLTISIVSGGSGPDGERSRHVDLQDQPELAGTILDALGLALLHRGRVDEARPLIEQGLQIRRQLYGEDHPATAGSLNSRARLHRQEGKLSAALADAERALAVSSRIYGGQSLPVALVLNDLAVIQLVLGEFTAAEQSAHGGLRILQALHLDCTDPHVTRLMDTLGRVQQVRGQYEQASETYLKLLDLDRRQVGEHHIKYASHLANFATLQVAQRQFEAAERDFNTALEVFRKDAHRPKHPNVIDILANLGSLLRQRGDLKGAARVLEEAVRLDSEIRGPNHVLLGNDHARLARVAHQAGRLGEAEQGLRRALEIYQRNVAEHRIPPAHPYIAEAKTWIARTLLESKSPRAREARQLAGEALPIWADEFGERSVEFAIGSAVLGRALYVIENDSAEARERLVNAYPIVVAARGADSAVARLIEAWRNEATGG